MSYFLCIQYPYELIEIALSQNEKVLEQTSLHKFDAVSLTIPTIQEFLSRHNLQLSSIRGLGINVGPGPYNTLRGLLTMANGIHQVTNIPMITSNALELISEQLTGINHLIILHAFENHVFFQFSDQRKPQSGSVQDLITLINERTEKLEIHGNGALRYAKTLEAACPDHIITPTTMIQFNPMANLVSATAQKFNSGSYHPTIAKPMYFEDLQLSSL